MARDHYDEYGNRKPVVTKTPKNRNEQKVERVSIAKSASNEEKFDEHIHKQRNSCACVVTSNKENYVELICDSGASQHLVNREEAFENIRDCDPVEFEIADGRKLKAEMKGNVRVLLQPIVKEHRKQQSTTLLLLNLYYVPSLDLSLFSVPNLDSSNTTCSIQNRKVMLFDRDDQTSSLEPHIRGITTICKLLTQL